MECTVCCEKYNKTNHKKVTCPFCDFESCKNCVQTYLLSSYENPHCMNCKNEINRGFVDSFCTKKFRNNVYKKHRECVLFEREKARMPETQPHVERIHKMRTLRQKYHELVAIIRNNRVLSMEAIREGTENSQYEIIIQNTINQTDIIVEEMNLLRYGDITEDSPRNFIRMCPSEECRGFIDEDYKCGLCKQVFCKKCNEKIEENHKCNPETVKTIKLINKDTKPCPKCGTMIHKIDGCLQMWCTSCNTAFNWRTGNIEKGRIHNPHFFEFQKRSREHADIPCGGRPTFNELRYENAPVNILDLCVVLHQIDRDIMYRYADIYDADNHHLRIAYMLNSIDETNFKIELQRRDKQVEKLNDIRDIYEMFTNACSDLMRQWVIDKSIEISEDVKELVKYSNSIVTQIRKRYNCTLPKYIHLIE